VLPRLIRRDQGGKMARRIGMGYDWKGGRDGDRVRTRKGGDRRKGSGE